MESVQAGDIRVSVDASRRWEGKKGCNSRGVPGPEHDAGG